MKINLKKFEPKIINKNNKEYIQCLVRNSLIRKTPEEIVRQSILKYLNEKLNISFENMSVEEWIADRSFRADIIVSSNETPILVIECKRNGKSLERAIDQAIEYNDEVYTNNFWVTNGDEIFCFTWDYEEEEYKSLVKIPDYAFLIDPNLKNVEIEEVIHFVRPNYSEINKNIKNMYNDGFIGEDTYTENKALLPFIVNLAYFLIDYDDKTSKYKIKDNFLLLDDLGYTFPNCSNSSGSSWDVEYRTFKVKYNNIDEIVYFSIVGCKGCKNDPINGTRKGYTMLNIAIGDSKTHNSLQLRLDSFTELKNKEVSIFHDGTLTCGNLGKVSNKYVIEFVKRKAPELIKNNRIELGTLDNSKNIIWDDSTKNFIANCCKYALIRDEFRTLYKANKNKLISSIGF